MKRLLHWLRRHQRRIVGYTGAQVLFQIISALTGFILVRALTKDDYAWFTIFNSLVTTVGILSDSGLGSATLSLGGTVTGDPGRFAGLIRSTRRLRLRFVVGGAAITLPAGWWMLHRNHAPTTVTITLLVIVLLTSLLSADVSILNTVNRLQTKLRNLVKADFVLGVSRLFIVCAGLASGLSAMLAALAAGVSQWLQAVLLRRQTREVIAVEDASGTDWSPAVMQVVKHMFPLCVFSCVQGQITTWLLSVFASTHDVADIGALSRLSVIFSFMAIPMAQLFGPAIARCQNPQRLRKLCFTVVAGYAAAGAGMALAGSLFSTPLLWLLGHQYANLHVELAWYLGYLAVGLWSTVVWGLALTRGWVRHAWLNIPLTLAAQATAAAFLDLSRVINVIVFSGIGAVASICISVWLILRGLSEHARIMAAAALPDSERS